jgi:hypothetical protein
MCENPYREVDVVVGHRDWAELVLEVVMHCGHAVDGNIANEFSVVLVVVTAQGITVELRIARRLVGQFAGVPVVVVRWGFDMLSA